MRVDYSFQIDTLICEVLLEHGKDAIIAVSISARRNNGDRPRFTYSAGFAGSMTIASFVLSSMSRYA